MKNTILVLTSILVMLSCKEPEDPNSIKNRIIGNWEAVEIIITIDKGQESEKVLLKGKITELDTTLLRGAYQSEFKTDGSVLTHYYNTGGGSAKITRSYWTVDHDTIEIREKETAENYVKYLVRIDSNHAFFSCYLDHDKDGYADDYYFADHLWVPPRK